MKKILLLFVTVMAATLHASADEPTYTAAAVTGNSSYTTSGYTPLVSSTKSTVKVYGTDSIWVDAWCGVEGYGICVVLDEAGHVSALNTVEGGKSRPRGSSTSYMYAYTGLDDYVDWAAYLRANGTYYYTSAYPGTEDDPSGYVEMWGWAYDSNNASSYQYYYIGWGSYAANTLTISETEAYTPVALTADVQLTRTLVADVWNTLALPFDVSNKELTALLGSDVKVAVFSNESDETVNFSTMETPSISANTPVLLKVSAVGESPYTFESRTIVVGTPTLTGAKVDFVGTYEPITDLYNVDTTRDLYAFLNNKIYLATSTAAAELKGTRAYLSVEKASGVKLLIDGEEEDATAIVGLSDKRESLSGTVYTVSGQRVNSVSKGGLYIVNGKKVLVK